MNDSDLQSIIEKTKEQIYLLKNQINEINDPKEKRMLKRRLRQLQIEQLKYLNKLG